MPAALTMDEAVELIAERVANGGGKKSKKAKAAPRPKTTKARRRSHEEPVRLHRLQHVEIGEAGNCEAS